MFDHDKWEHRFQTWPNWQIEAVMFAFGILAWLMLNCIAKPLSFIIGMIATFTNSPSAWMTYQDSKERLAEVEEDQKNASN